MLITNRRIPSYLGSKKHNVASGSFYTILLKSNEQPHSAREAQPFSLKNSCVIKLEPPTFCLHMYYTGNLGIRTCFLTIKFGLVSFLKQPILELRRPVLSFIQPFFIRC